MLGKGEAAAAQQEHEVEEEGETAGVVKLISAEGFEFVVDKKAAMVSNTLRNMLTSPGGFSETREGEVRFPEISTPILEKICQYFYWSLHYSGLLLAHKVLCGSLEDITNLSNNSAPNV